MSRRRRLLALLLLVFLCGCPVYPDVVPPEPEPDPSPIVVDALKVIVIEESGERSKLSRGQLNVIASVKLRTDITQRQGDFLLIDKDASVENAEKWVQESLALERDSLPWMIVVGPNGAWLGPLPDSVEKVIGYIEEIK